MALSQLSSFQCCDLGCLLGCQSPPVLACWPSQILQASRRVCELLDCFPTFFVVWLNRVNFWCQKPRTLTGAASVPPDPLQGFRGTRREERKPEKQNKGRDPAADEAKHCKSVGRRMGSRSGGGVRGRGGSRE